MSPREPPAEAPGPVAHRVPNSLLVLAGLVSACGVTMVLLGGWTIGVSWDETYHVLRMRNFLATGWYLLDGDLLGDRPGPWEDQLHVYAPVAMSLLHGWTMLWGLEGPGQVSASASAFAVRHLGVGLVAALGVASAASLARLVLGGWRWALVASAFLLALPIWTGHAMFNVKDVPVATGYTMTTLGLALLATSTAGVGRRAWLGAVTAVVGVVLAVGTRPGIWPGLVLAFLGLGGVLVITAIQSPTSRRSVVARAGLAGAVLLVAGAAVGMLYPEAFRSPVSALLDAALESSRFDGRKGHWWYVPLFLLVEIPTLHLLLAATGVLACGRLVWRRRRDLDLDPVACVTVLVLLQALSLPALAILRESNLYTGLRQLLFLTPALAVLATVGTAALLAQAAGRRRLRRTTAAAVGLALVAPVLVQLQVFPYNYSATTAIANAAAPLVDGAPEIPTDYWRGSVRELAPGIPEGGFVACSPLTDDRGRFLPFGNDSHQDCAVDPVGPLAPYDGLRHGTWDSAPTRFLAVETGTSSIPDNCTKLGEVTRWLLWRRVTMAYVARCDLVLEPYPDEGLTFAGDGTGGSVVLGGWSVLESEPGIGLTGESAEIGFTLRARDDGRALRLHADVLGRRGAAVAANGAPVRVEPDPADGQRLWITVPASAAARYGQRRLVLTFTDEAGPHLRLLALSIEGGTAE